MHVRRQQNGSPKGRATHYEADVHSSYVEHCVGALTKCRWNGSAVAERRGWAPFGGGFDMKFRILYFVAKYENGSGPAFELVCGCDRPWRLLSGCPFPCLFVGFLQLWLPGQGQGQGQDGWRLDHGDTFLAVRSNL